MEIQILHLIEGARQATGLTVIIDVFRAFTVEAYLIHKRAEKVIPVKDIQTAFDYKARHPDAIVCGERGGVMVEGFDFGNSPSQLERANLSGKTVVHTTSAGTQGIANAIHADEIIGGSLVCARAIAEYIKRANPQTVSLVCMGLDGKTPTDEDFLCAEYIKSLVEGKPFPELAQRIAQLKQTDGAKFFNPTLQDIFPERDFQMSVQADIFPFVLRLKQDPSEGLAYMERINILKFRDCWDAWEPTIVHPGDRISQFLRDQTIGFPKEVKTQVVYGRHAPAKGDFDCAVVLGGPPEFMKSRAMAAAQLYQAGRVPHLIVTGGVCRESAFGFLSEAQILARYLEQAGVPAECIMFEEQAANTTENMSLCNSLLEEKFPGKSLRLVVVTSNFHIYRATELAKYYFPTHKLSGIGALHPHDNAAECWDDPVIRPWLTTECRCLWSHVKNGLIPDFPVL